MAPNRQGGKNFFFLFDFFPLERKNRVEDNDYKKKKKFISGSALLSSA